MKPSLLLTSEPEAIEFSVLGTTEKRKVSARKHEQIRRAEKLCGRSPSTAALGNH